MEHKSGFCAEPVKCTLVDLQTGQDQRSCFVDTELLFGYFWIENFEASPSC